MRELYPNEEKFKLLLRNGVYPYEYMNSFARFAETFLLLQEKFYSYFYNEGVSDADYAHACLVW